MPPINNAQAAKLRDIKNLESLIEYLHEELDWPLDLENISDAYFDYDADEIGLDEESAAKIKAIKQLRPLTNAQPWGIFFVEFNDKKLPIVALRRILRGLVVKRRASGADRQRWQTKDLLFVSAFGESGDRQITFAHFTDESEAGDLPTLRVLGWDAADTGSQLERTATVLHEHLHWPAAPIDAERWRNSWSAAFRLKVNQVINDSKSLAKLLAVLAARIRQRANAVLALETSKGPLRTMAKAFRDSLISDLSDDKFADMYAQTVTYGMFAARVGRQSGGLVADDLSSYVSTTSPFLKEMLGSFLDVSGRARARTNRIDFDELGINELVEALRAAPIADIVAQFGNERPDDDPVIHFYEDFLAAYDKALKVQRGVFYTPKPVVSYIVRSVHELLQSEFGLADGLADTATWGEMLKKHPTLKLPMRSDDQQEKETISPDEPFVQILDPATGTATFLIEVIDVIHKTMTAKWKSAGLNEARRTEAWNEYVPKHLLPRLFGYELMMAPYAIAHMKLGLKLAETRYNFLTEARAQVYLTNALQPALGQMPLIGFDALAHEAAAVNEIKRHKRFTVVIGNPPYAVNSANKNSPIDPYLSIYKEGLDGERNLKPLNDDYLKFLLFAQMRVAGAGCGVLGIITNHSFATERLFRGVRRSLLQFYTGVQFLDLLGAMTRDPSMSEDENVFDIQQGVAISLLSRWRTTDDSRPGVLRYDLIGTRDSKYKWLAKNSVVSTEWVSVDARTPLLLFSHRSAVLESEYSAFIPLNQLFIAGNVGYQTHRDGFVIDTDRFRLLERLEDFRSTTGDESELSFITGLTSNRDWSLREAHQHLSREQDLAETVLETLYRPFDIRHICFAPYMIDYDRRELMRHMVAGNVGLLVSKVFDEHEFTSVFVTKWIVESKAADRTRGSYLYPLYLLESDGRLNFSGDRGKARTLNFRQDTLARIHSSLVRGSGEQNDARPEPDSIFTYLYAIFHSPTYRSRYADFLKSDFPRLPLTGNFELFRALARLGGGLTSLHLLDSPKVGEPITEFVGSRTPEVEKVSWASDAVWVDKAQSIGFRGVRAEVWNFHIGGYQVCEKWLKDRKGRTLSAEDVAHYQKIVVAISESIRIMAEIDRVIDEHGGWPGAFITEPLAVEAEVTPLSTSEPEPRSAAPAKTRVARKTTGPDPMDLFTTAANDESDEITKLAAESEKSYDVSSSRKSDEITANDAIGALRECLSGGALSRDELIRAAAHQLGFGRTGSLIREALDGHIRAAVRRGVLFNQGDTLSLAVRRIEDFDRNHLKDQFLAALAAESSGYIERADAIRAFARWLGFARTGEKIEAAALSLINGLLREGRLEASDSTIRKAR